MPHSVNKNGCRLFLETLVKDILLYLYLTISVQTYIIQMRMACLTSFELFLRQNTTETLEDPSLIY